jgi:hypothetical protein
VLQAQHSRLAPLKKLDLPEPLAPTAGRERTLVEQSSTFLHTVFGDAAACPEPTYAVDLGTERLRNGLVFVACKAFNDYLSSFQHQCMSSTGLALPALTAWQQHTPPA